MQVVNYTQDLDAWNAYANEGRGSSGVKRTAGTISQRAYKRLMRESKEFLNGFGIDFSQYDDGSVIFHDMLVAQIEWTHKTNGNKICLTEIHFEKQTGEIIHAGSNYGNLCF